MSETITLQPASPSDLGELSPFNEEPIELFESQPSDPFVSELGGFSNAEVQAFAIELDQALTPLLAAHGETIIICSRAGGAEMTLSEAVMTIWPVSNKGAMIREGLPSVMAEINNMLSNRPAEVIEELEEAKTEEEPQAEPIVAEQRNESPKVETVEMRPEPVVMPEPQRVAAVMESQTMVPESSVVLQAPEVEIVLAAEAFVAPKVEAVSEPIVQIIAQEKPMSDQLLELSIEQTKPAAEALDIDLETKLETHTEEPETMAQEVSVLIANEVELPIPEIIEPLTVASAVETDNTVLTDTQTESSKAYLAIVEQPAEVVAEPVVLPEAIKSYLESWHNAFEPLLATGIETPQNEMSEEQAAYGTEPMLTELNYQPEEVDSIFGLHAAEQQIIGEQVIDDVLAEAVEVVEGMDMAMLVTVNDALDKIMGAVSSQEAQQEGIGVSVENIAEVDELLAEIFYSMGIEYSDEMITSLKLAILKHELIDTKDIVSVEDEENIIAEKVKKKLQKIFAAIRTMIRAMGHSRVIGGSAIRLYEPNLLAAAA